jgi:hypothetical protein
VGDDVAYTAQQIGHEDPAFTLRVYTHAVKRRPRLVGRELLEFERALAWAQWAQMPSLVPKSPGIPLIVLSPKRVERLRN